MARIRRFELRYRRVFSYDLTSRNAYVRAKFSRFSNESHTFTQRSFYTAGIGQLFNCTVIVFGLRYRPFIVPLFTAASRIAISLNVNATHCPLPLRGFANSAFPTEANAPLCRLLCLVGRRRVLTSGCYHATVVSVYKPWQVENRRREWCSARWNLLSGSNDVTVHSNSLFGERVEARQTPASKEEESKVEERRDSGSLSIS